MKTLKMKWKRNVMAVALIVVQTLFMTSCSDETIREGSRRLAIEATDAPIDNAEVKGVFVTVSEIYVDNKKIEGFNKTTLEISALYRR